METSRHEPSAAPLLDPASNELIIRVSVGTILGRSFRLLMKNFVGFIVLSAIVQLPTLLVLLGLRGGSQDDVMGAAIGVSGLLEMMLSNVAAGAVTYGVIMQLRGERVGMLRSVGVGLKRLFPVLLVGFLVVILVCVGLLALRIPGIILQCMFFVAVPAAIIEKPGIFGALCRSRALTSGYKLSIFGATFLLGLLTIVSLVVAMVVGKDRIDSDGGLSFMISFWVGGVIIGAWRAVAAAVTYHDLRALKEGTQVDELVKVFE